MQELQIPSKLQESYLSWAQYPENLLSSSTDTYSGDLQIYKRLLDRVENDLFVDCGPDADIEVSFRDLHNAAGNELQKLNAHDGDKARNFLGLQLVPDANNPAKSVMIAQRRDPGSRFIYIKGQHSRAPLNITRQLMCEIFSYHQVMPIYLDFMFVFGAQSEPRDRRFSGFRQQSFLSDPPRGLPVPSLGRSGRLYQLCYNLKTVTLKSEDPKNISLNEWSVQPAAIHHRFDIVYGTTLWIVTKGGDDLLERYKSLTGPEGRPENKTFDTLQDSFRASLAPHLLFAHWSTANWRWYILWLESLLEKETSMAVLGLRGSGRAQYTYTIRHLQTVTAREDQISEAIMLLEANVDVMQSLCNFYDSLRTKKEIPQTLRDECDTDITTFIAQATDMISNLKLQIVRANLLNKITKDRKELIIQLLQTQAAERMEELNLNMEGEAIVMRIITIVTLVYLPATFVSTFFSTDIIKYQDQAGGPPTDGVFSSVAMYRWLQVTLPLTFFTFIGAFWALRIAEKKRWGRDDPSQKQQPRNLTRSMSDPNFDTILPTVNNAGSVV
ncbi:hypothetical protein Z517_01784 [Fonsecaea pedrosoi CBS 271.37]|uniref:Unplaced genomic scaffold supercont1.1, whole genome shotgun sequence n=1 Tax=Fonsecaea pedrosoi CBS 271.37 TaxID=1442368 RepID=A0A0D2GZB0_9EURO|nr:uncharacterized protein Z517_01784 [Fonsecaea pedrosoi CBS 271.37]KIW86388.1 hypothetical protein Z517_01784 [Fonsecaea pedrosoi CBS 271.37]